MIGKLEGPKRPKGSGELVILVCSGITNEHRFCYVFVLCCLLFNLSLSRSEDIQLVLHPRVNVSQRMAIGDLRSSG